MINKLGIDLYTYVIDWEDFKDLQLAYIKASVLDIDVPADQLIFASLFKVARDKKIKYIIAGNNVVTEGILPKSWNFQNKFDLKNLKAIHKAYGTRKVKNYPKFGKWQRFYYEHLHRIKIINILNYVSYNKKETMDFLKAEFGWRDYGWKHFESIFTRFYQGYMLPVKFNIDKRKAHLSTLILSGQISRDEAIAELKRDFYPKNLQESDKEFFIKKFGFTDEEFKEIMNTPVRRHEDFEIEGSVYKEYPFLILLKPLINLLKRLTRK